jgi:hypothetical protein
MKHNNGQPSKRMAAIEVAEEVMRYTTRWRRRSEAKVLIVLAHFVGKERDSWVWPRRKTLMERAGVSLSVVERALRRAVADGLIERQQRPGSNRSSRYRFLDEVTRHDGDGSTTPKGHVTMVTGEKSVTRHDGDVRIEGHSFFEGHLKKDVKVSVKASAHTQTMTSSFSKTSAGGKINSGSQTQDQPASYGSAPPAPKKPKKPKKPPGSEPLVKLWNDFVTRDLTPVYKASWLEDSDAEATVAKLLVTDADAPAWLKKDLNRAFRKHPLAWWGSLFDIIRAKPFLLGLLGENGSATTLQWLVSKNCEFAERIVGREFGMPLEEQETRDKALAWLKDTDPERYGKLAADPNHLYWVASVAYKEMLKYEKANAAEKEEPPPDPPAEKASPETPKETVDVGMETRAEMLKSKAETLKMKAEMGAEACLCEECHPVHDDPPAEKVIPSTEAIEWFKTEFPIRYEKIADDPARLEREVSHAYGKSLNGHSYKKTPVSLMEPARSPWTGIPIGSMERNLAWFKTEFPDKYEDLAADPAGLEREASAAHMQWSKQKLKESMGLDKLNGHGA